LIEVYKLLAGKENINYDQFFQLSNKQSRFEGTLTEAISTPFGIGSRKVFFSQHVVGPWNKLSKNVIEVSTVNSFKNKYDQWRSSTNKIRIIKAFRLHSSSNNK